ncbi:MAG: hypothetical protein KDN22_17915, partial [Verrucomicrobiae bacterium]|nr:hypothetical protein [Verrucomicrobiae bacterium]
VDSNPVDSSQAVSSQVVRVVVENLRSNQAMAPNKHLEKVAKAILTVPQALRGLASNQVASNQVASNQVVNSRVVKVQAAGHALLLTDKVPPLAVAEEAEPDALKRTSTRTVSSKTHKIPTKR